MTERKGSMNQKRQLTLGLHMVNCLKASQDSKAETHVSSSSCRLL